MLLLLYLILPIFAVECLDPDHNHLSSNRNTIVNRGSTGDENEAIINHPQIPHHPYHIPQQPMQVSSVYCVR